MAESHRLECNCNLILHWDITTIQSKHALCSDVNNKSCLFFKLPSLDNTLSSTAEQTNIMAESDQPEWRSKSPSRN